MRRTDLEQIIKANPAGVTLYRSGLFSPDHGYIVAESGALSLTGAIARLKHGKLVRGWIDSVTGKFALEAVVYIHLQKGWALALAKENGKKAIYGFAEKAVIYV